MWIVLLSIYFAISCILFLYLVNSSFRKLEQSYKYTALLAAEAKLYRDIGNKCRIRLYRQRALNSMKEKEESIRIEQNHAMFRSKARRQ